MSDQPFSRNAEDFRMVNLGEFARLMGVSVGTVRNWMDAGKLKEGRNYLQEGRVIRFPWSKAVVAELMRDWPRQAPRRTRMKSFSTNRRALKLRA